VLFYQDQLACDAFTAEFKQIAKLASEILNEHGCDSGGARFSFEVGVVPGLYLTAWKCRDRVVRRQAIGLLDRARIEGVWNGRAMVAVGR
jgi:hypothetical protein